MQKTIMTVVGARPQLIKAAATSGALRKNFREILVHTGQHYDYNMSEIFFEQLGVPAPDYNLGIGSKSHGKQTGEMLAAIEELVLSMKPDLLLVYGDTNSTLAGALAASKLHIPVAHIEAGLRSFNKAMPEEQNRILTDHLASILFAPSKTAVLNLMNETINDSVYCVGDVMYDAAIQFSRHIEETSLCGKYDTARPFLLATIHRAENTDNPETLSNIVAAFNAAGKRIILPLHPRTRQVLDTYNLQFSGNVEIFDPVGYMEMLFLERHSEKIVTDSGGIQKEAYFFSKPCITLRQDTEWVETVEAGWNRLVGSDRIAIQQAISDFSPDGPLPPFFGDGHAAIKISELLMDFFGQ